MRNTVEYPVTKKEIIECLYRMANDLDDGRFSCGDMRPLLLRHALEIVESSDFNENPGPIGKE